MALAAVAGVASWEGAFAGCAALESAFYGLIRPGCLRERSIQWIQNTAIKHIELFQQIFAVINYVLVAVPPTFMILSAALPLMTDPDLITVVIGSVTLGGIALASVSTSTLTRYLHTAKLALSVGLLFFANNPAWLALSLVGISYSIWKHRQLMWIIPQAHQINLNYRNGATTFAEAASGISCNYEVLCLRANPNTDQICTICLDPNPNIWFCRNHAFHDTCISSWLQARNATLLNNAAWTRHITQILNEYGRHTGTKKKYSVTIPRANLPTCPNCRAAPLQGKAVIHRGGRLATVTLRDASSTS